MVTKAEIGAEMKGKLEEWKVELVRIRKERGVPQRRMVEKFGCTPGYVSQVESGTIGMTWRMLSVYLDVLDMEVGLGPRVKRKAS